MNAPERYEIYLVPEGSKKLNYQVDSRVPNAANIKIEKEDHTLGNMLRSQLLHDERVLFAGYKNEHPLDHSIVLRVQTVDDYSPREAVMNAARMLLVSLNQLKTNFAQEWELKRITAEVVD